MTELIAQIDRLVSAFGAATALALLIAAVIGYLYRRDVLIDRADARKSTADTQLLSKQLLDVIARNSTAGEELSQTVARLAEAIRAAEEMRGQNLARLVESIRDAEVQRARGFEALVVAIRGLA